MDAQCSKKRKNQGYLKLGHCSNDADIPVDFYDGNIRQYLKNDILRQDIILKFQRFLKNYKLDGKKVYIHNLNELARTGGRSLVVDYHQMATLIPNICIWLADAPGMIFELLNRSVQTLLEEIYPKLFEVNASINIRITNLPVCDSIRNLRQIQLNSLVCVTGVVTTITAVLPQLNIATYICDKCFYKTAPLKQNNLEVEIGPHSCVNCQSKGPFTLNEMDSTYRNYQRIKIQELASSIICGRLPRSKQIILIDDLVNLANPGDEIEITGIYKNVLDRQQKLDREFPVFDSLIEANYIQKKEDKYIIHSSTYDDHYDILNLSKYPHLLKLITTSIAPFIYGHEYIKNALTLSLFGGQEKKYGNHRLRGDINILMLGDPGTAKSQFLKYIEKTFDKTVFTTGRGASAVGLTASVQKDPLTKEWSLRGGALVLANKGVCLIDEFDKMNDQDRVSIHEAMEQQTISISKAGILAQLQARCTVIAAANPVGGFYDSSYSLRQNVNLSDPILSRFDLICLLEDTITPGIDEKLAEFVIKSHIRHSLPPDNDHLQNNIHENIESDLLRRYVRYARHQIKPRLHSSSDEKIAKIYVELRKISTENTGLPISIRHLESIIRLTEAYARIHLRDYIIDDDVNLSIKMMIKSYIASQRLWLREALEHKFKHFITYQTDQFERKLFILKKLVKNQLKVEAMTRVQTTKDIKTGYLAIDTSHFLNKLRENYIIDNEQFFDDSRFYEAGFSISDDHSIIYYQI